MPFLRSTFGYRFPVDLPGAVDHNVQAAKAVEDIFTQRLDLLQLRYIGPVTDGLDSGGLGGGSDSLRTRFIRPVADCHLHTLTGQREGDLAPDTP